MVYSEIELCKNAPSEYANRENLWNAVHKVEKAKNAQLWREIEVAIPKEFNRQEQIETVRKFVKRLTNEGMCADWSINEDIRKSNEEIEEIEKQLAELKNEKKKILKEIENENKIEQKENDKNEKYIENFGLHNWKVIKEMNEVSKALNILSDRNVKDSDDLTSKIKSARQRQI